VKTSSFGLLAKVDPGELGVNIRFKRSQAIHPRAKKAQRALVEAIKKEIEGRPYEPCSRCYLSLVFTFANNRFDVDGPVKRTMDAVEMALKELGHKWNDRKVVEVRMAKQVGPEPNIDLMMFPII
jgi:hypothetical protein